MSPSLPSCMGGGDGVLGLLLCMGGLGNALLHSRGGSRTSRTLALEVLTQLEPRTEDSLLGESVPPGSQVLSQTQAPHSRPGSGSS